MWGRFVKYDGQKISEIVDEKPIILATNISVKSYRGKYYKSQSYKLYKNIYTFSLTLFHFEKGLTLSTTSSSNFTINPALPQATTMRKW